MSRAVVAACCEGLQNTDEGGIGAFPFTIYAWVKPAGDNAGGTMAAHVDSGSNTKYYQMAQRGTDKGAVVARNDTFLVAEGTTDIRQAWHSLLTSYVTDTSKKIFVDGTDEATLTTNVTYATSVNSLSIGYLNRTVLADYFDGDIGYVALWDVTLSSNEITALSNGINPWAIRNQNLVTYAELHGDEDPEPNWANREAFGSPTNFGLKVTPTKSTTNPPVQLLSRYI